METIFMCKGKKLFEVNGIVNLDAGDVVEFAKLEYDVTPTDDYPFPEYKVIGRKFRYIPAFSGKLFIYLR